MKRQTPMQTKRAKSLRVAQTKAEGLLWSVLRGKQLCDMKFRRQHPIGPFFADFACVSRRLVVELDGSYHDLIQDKDLQRQQYLVVHGWNVIRFSNEEVLRDVEAVLRAIASSVDEIYSHQKRTDKLGGMMGKTDPNQPRVAPHPAATASDLPGGEVKDV